jgi:hypothetical protein
MSRTVGRPKLGPRTLERLGSAADAQEAGALLEGPRPEARNGEQVLAAAERPVGVGVDVDRLGDRRPEARDMGEQRRRGHVEVDADRVHRVFDDGLKGAAEAGLVDVVLVLADADRLGLDLDELGERVLQAARD